MAIRASTSLVSIVTCAIVLFGAQSARAQQQDLGHKALGTLGLGAGSQPSAGVYAAYRFLWYSANDLIDRNGRSLPVGLDIDAVVNGFGVGASYELPWGSTYFNASAAVPIGSVSINTKQPEASIDDFGFGDLYVEPIKIGWKTSQLDLVGGYAFYAPTGQVEPGGLGGIGRGQWTHEFSLGTAVYFDREKTWQLSALASYDLNSKKRNIDITRGDTIQVQGGIGKTFAALVEVGLAGYALWQVSDDSGADLPAFLRGARDQSFGLGPELNVNIPFIRGRLTMRYEHDISVRSRPLGQIFLVGLTIAAFTPG